MNLRRILLILARFLAFAAVAEAMAIWVFWRSTWTPIERHYLPAYIWCSLPIVTPETIEVRLIWKTARHRKRELAADDDAVNSANGTGMALSESAMDAGWKALTEGPPREVPAEVLRPDLASLAFEGQSLWDLLLLPELSSLAVLCVALCAWFLLIGFLRALIAEYAWRRRLTSRQELLPSLFKDGAAQAQRVGSEFAALHRSAVQRIKTHRTAPRPNFVPAGPPALPVSFALPLFGVHNGTGRGHLWSEKDEIE
ncbi:MAG TPA: hypothetical protein VME23_13840 [Terracidiphilus sp.]|nr:hypothetical protein [Terracidiphilus sp.]